jgi:hypothetical protein
MYIVDENRQIKYNNIKFNCSGDSSNNRYGRLRSLAFFQVGDLRTVISAIRIVSKPSLAFPLRGNVPRGSHSADVGKLTLNVVSRKVLRFNGLSIVLHLHRPYRLLCGGLWCGGSFSDNVSAATSWVPVRYEAYPVTKIRGVISDYPL